MGSNPTSTATLKPPDCDSRYRHIGTTGSPWRVTGCRPEVRHGPFVAGLPSRSWCAGLPSRSPSGLRRRGHCGRVIATLAANERTSRPGWPPSSGATTPPRPPSIGGSPPVTSTTSLACIDGHEQAPITQAARLRVTSTTSVGVCRVLRAHRDQSPPQQLGRLALQQARPLQARRTRPASGRGSSRARNPSSTPWTRTDSGTFGASWTPSRPGWLTSISDRGAADARDTSWRCALAAPRSRATRRSNEAPRVRLPGRTRRRPAITGRW